MWWVMGIVLYHLGPGAHGKVGRGSTGDYRDLSMGEQMTAYKRGTREGAKGIIIGDFMGRAIECGFLRRADEEYIYGYLNRHPVN